MSFVKIIIKPLLTIFVIIFLLKLVPFSLLKKTLREISFTNFIWIILLSLSMVISKSLRWWKILHKSGHPVEWILATNSYFASLALGGVTPGRLGEFLRVFTIKTTERLEVFMTVIADRLFDLIFLIAAATIGCCLYFLGQDFIFFENIQLIFGLCLLLILYQCLIKIFFPYLPRILQKISEKTFFSFKNNLTWMLTGISYLFYTLGTQQLAVTMNIPLSLHDSLFIISMFGLLALIPITIGGLGLRDAFLIYYFLQLNIHRDHAIIFSLIHFSIFFALPAFVGAICLIHLEIDYTAMKEDCKNISREFYSQWKRRV